LELAFGHVPPLADYLIYCIQHAPRDAKPILKLLPQSPHVVAIEEKMSIMLCFMFTKGIYCLAGMCQMTVRQESSCTHSAKQQRPYE